jgi:tetratricopeptide (TPR) repeat protein
LELLAPISFFTHSRVAITRLVDCRFTQADTSLLISQYNQWRSLTFENYLNIARFQSAVAVDDYRMTYAAIQECLKRKPENRESLTILAAVSKAMNATAERLSALAGLINVLQESAPLILTYATELSAFRSSGDPAAAAIPLDNPIRWLRRGAELTERQDERYFIRLGEFLSATGKPAEAAEAYAAALTLRDTYEPMETSLTDDELAFLATRNYLDAHDTASSLIYLDRLKELNPQHVALSSLALELAAEKKDSSLWHP